MQDRGKSHKGNRGKVEKKCHAEGTISQKLKYTNLSLFSGSDEGALSKKEPEEGVQGSVLKLKIAPPKADSFWIEGDIRTAEREYEGCSQKVKSGPKK